MASNRDDEWARLQIENWERRREQQMRDMRETVEYARQLRDQERAAAVLRTIRYRFTNQQF